MAHWVGLLQICFTPRWLVTTAQTVSLSASMMVLRIVILRPSASRSTTTRSPPRSICHSCFVNDAHRSSRLTRPCLGCLTSYSLHRSLCQVLHDHVWKNILDIPKIAIRCSFCQNDGSSSCPSPPQGLHPTIA